MQFIGKAICRNLFRENCKRASAICASLPKANVRGSCTSKNLPIGKRKILHFMIGDGFDTNSFGSRYRVARAQKNLGVKYQFPLRQKHFPDTPRIKSLNFAQGEARGERAP